MYISASQFIAEFRGQGGRIAALADASAPGSVGLYMSRPDSASARQMRREVIANPLIETAVLVELLRERASSAGALSEAA